MRKFTIAFLRTPNHTFLKSPSLPFNTLACTPDEANVRKARELNGCVSLAEGKAGARPTSAKAKRSKAKAKATELSGIGVFKADDVIVHEEEEAAAPGKTEEAALHAEEKAVQNAAIERSGEVANESIINAKEELSVWVAKLDLSTFKRGRWWEEIAYKLLDHGIPSAHVKKMLPRCRTLSGGKNPSVKHLTILGMSHEQMGRVISRWPSILNVSSNVFQSKVEFFESVGIDRRSFCEIMPQLSRALQLSLSTLKARCEFWKNYFQDVQENALPTLILRNPQVLNSNFQQTVKPTIAHLEELGVSKKMLLRHSSILSYSRKAIAMKLKLLEQFGIPNVTALVMLRRTSAPTLYAKLHNLLALGFSFDHVQKIMVNYSQIVNLREDNIKLRLSYAVNVMNLSFDALAAYPAFWGTSMKRIKYRYEVLQELKTLGAYEKNICLSYMLNMTDAVFSRRFVKRLQAYTKHANVSSCKLFCEPW